MDRSADTLPKLPSVSEWRTHLQSRGIRPEIVKEYLEYIKPLARRGVPVIFDFRHLCDLLGRTPDFLARATNSPSHFYRNFDIPKKSGGIRSISAPYPSLKECQRWIADQILSRVPTHPASTAYHAKSSIIGNIAPHLCKDNHVLIVDIKDFFPSISKRRIVGWFSSLGYNPEVAVALASLCCLDGHLPQGSPASPHLSNAICRTLDQRLTGIANRLNLKYTRYADDICFSGSSMPTILSKLVNTALRDSGFSVNPDKTRMHKPRATSKVVTGINIAEGIARLPRNRRRLISQEMYFIETFGFISHRSKLKITDPKYLLRLRGQLEFWRLIEPNNERVLGFIDRIRQLQILHESE